MQKTNVGNVEVIALVDCIEAYPAPAVYPRAGEKLDGYKHYLDAEGRLALNFGCFLVRDGAQTILVDTGWGASHNGQLPSELESAGVGPDEIDTVIFTHLHGDHTGWNMDPATGKPRFTKARYLVPGADWAHYSKQQPVPDSFESDVRPLLQAGVMELFDGERTLGPSTTAVPTPGHTPGHTSLAIVSGSERGYILGDVVLTPIDAEQPDLANSFDWDEELARATRLRTVEQLVSDGSLVGASHLPAPGLGRFVRVDGRTRWQAV